MSSPTEQLIRDYLYRLSAAAKDKLSDEDRKVLVARTRDFIDHNASASGAATAMEVATLLSRLGDPAALVAREALRLGAGHDEATAVSATVGAKRHGMFRRRSGRASSYWPLLPGNPAVQVRLLGSQDQAEGRSGRKPGPVPASTGPASTVPASTGPAGTASSSTASGSTGAADANGTGREPLPAPASQPEEPPIWVPRQAFSPEAGVQATGEPSPSGPGSTPTVAMGPDAGSWPDPRLSELASGEPVSRRIARTSATLIEAAVKLARDHPVEAIAAVLLGLGGAVYPPVWLAGVIVALASKAWDYRDKWIGLAGPVLLLVVGTVAGISLGASHSSMGGYAHEGWIYADVLSRVGAILGSAYLVWRLRHGRRKPPIPPWTKPHKVG
jgi:hypothetical protein